MATQTLNPDAIQKKYLLLKRKRAEFRLKNEMAFAIAEFQSRRRRAMPLYMIERKAGIGQGLLTKILDGSTKRMKPETARKLSIVLGVCPDRFFPENEWQKKHAGTQQVHDWIAEAFDPEIHTEQDLSCARECLGPCNELPWNIPPIQGIRCLLDVVANLRRSNLPTDPFHVLGFLIAHNYQQIVHSPSSGGIES